MNCPSCGSDNMCKDGFQRSGRHWVNEEHELFLEFPATALEEGETAATIEVGKYSVLVIGLEELIVDRLAAWSFWNSEIDGLNAYLLMGTGTDVDQGRLRQLALSREVGAVLEELNRFVDRQGARNPKPDELESWARGALKGMR